MCIKKPHLSDTKGTVLKRPLFLCVFSAKYKFLYLYGPNKDGPLSPPKFFLIIGVN